MTNLLYPRALGRTRLDQRLYGHQDIHNKHKSARKTGPLAGEVTNSSVAHPLTHMVSAPSGNDPYAHQLNV